MDNLDKENVKWEKQKQKWEKQKLKGKTKFILFYGVFLYGLTASIIYSIVTILFGNNLGGLSIPVIVIRFLIYLILFGISGILFGYGMWQSKIRKFD